MITSSLEDTRIDMDFNAGSGGNCERVDLSKKLWWNGLRLSLPVIADCLNMSTSQLRSQAKRYDMDIAEYLKIVKPRITNLNRRVV